MVALATVQSGRSFISLTISTSESQVPAEASNSSQGIKTFVLECCIRNSFLNNELKLQALQIFEEMKRYLSLTILCEVEDAIKS